MPLPASLILSLRYLTVLPLPPVFVLLLCPVHPVLGDRLLHPLLPGLLQGVSTTSGRTQIRAQKISPLDRACRGGEDALRRRRRGRGGGSLGRQILAAPAPLGGGSFGATDPGGDGRGVPAAGRRAPTPGGGGGGGRGAAAPWGRGGERPNSRKKREEDRLP